jgi:SAM-dependent methyltransferase
VGCGVGATALWLARTYGCAVTGVTNSSVQVELARRSAGALPVRFVEADAETLDLDERFDVVLLVGVLGHLHDQAGFLARSARLLAPGGRLVVTDWMAARADARAWTRDLGPLAAGFLTPELHSLAEHAAAADSGGLHVLAIEDLTPHTRASWGWRSNAVLPPVALISLLGRRAFWRLARKLRADLVPLVRALRAMKRAIHRGELIYGLLAAERPVHGQPHPGK